VAKSSLGIWGTGMWRWAGVNVRPLVFAWGRKRGNARSYFVRYREDSREHAQVVDGGKRVVNGKVVLSVEKRGQGTGLK